MRKMIKTIIDVINNNQEIDLQDNVSLIKQLLINELTTDQSIEVFEIVKKEFMTLMENRRIDAKKENQLIDRYFEIPVKETISLKMFNDTIFSRKLAEVEVNY